MSSSISPPLSDEVRSRVERLGFGSVTFKGAAGICGVKPYLFTGALVVGINPVQYQGRYCYATLTEAQEVLATWDGNGDPAGAWIKYKGLDGERDGPGLVG